MRCIGEFISTHSLHAWITTQIAGVQTATAVVVGVPGTSPTRRRINRGRCERRKRARRKHRQTITEAMREREAKGGDEDAATKATTTKAAQVQRRATVTNNKSSLQSESAVSDATNKTEDTDGDDGEPATNDDDDEAARATGEVPFALLRPAAWARRSGRLSRSRGA
jgi:hypothetical protein